MFRDVDELPLSDNLSEPITNALANSDYLITLCTPRYPQSRWCLKEIETFLQTHPRDHILVVLAEGEPVDSFPEILTFEQVEVKDENGSVRFERKQIEPLAADTRGENKKEILKAMDIAVIKLCAAMFGLNYDDLKQRHREQKMRRMMTVFGIIGAFLFCFAAVVTGMLFKISKQNNIISSQYSELKDKYADTVADKAAELLGNGRRMDAVYALRSVLPDNPSEGYNANALRGLYSAMGIYGSDTIYMPGTVYEMNSAVYDYLVSDDGSYILINDLLSMKLFSGSGEMIREFDNESTYSFTEGVFCGDGAIVYVYGDEIRFYDIESGEDTEITGFEEMCELFGTGAGMVIVYSDDSLLAIDDSGEIAYSIDLTDVFGYSGLMVSDLDSSDKYLACSFSDFTDYYLMIADIHSGEVTDVIDVQSDYVIYVCMGDEYLYYALTEYGDNGEEKCAVHAVRPHSGNEMYSAGTEGGTVNDIWEKDGYLYVYTLYGVEIYASKDGKKVSVYQPDGEIVCGIDTDTGMKFVSDTGKVYESYGDTFYEVSGQFLPTDHAGKIAAMKYLGFSYFIHFERADYITAYDPVMISYDGSEADPDFEDLYGEDATFDLQDDEKFNSLLLDQAIYSEDGKYIVASYSNHTVRIHDADTYECINSFDMDEYVVSFYYSKTVKGYIMICEDASFILDEDFNIICDVGLIAGEKNGKLIMGDSMGEFHSVDWVDYKELISLADEYLGDHEPRESIREKYGI